MSDERPTEDKPLTSQLYDAVNARQEALEKVYGALGPNAGSCPTNECDGCRAEMEIALEAVKPFIDEDAYWEEAQAELEDDHGD